MWCVVGKDTRTMRLQQTFGERAEKYIANPQTSLRPLPSAAETRALDEQTKAPRSTA